MQDSTGTTKHEVTRKRNTKRLKHKGHLFRKNLQLIGVFQRKAFYRQNIQESSCARKETLDIDIFVTFRNGD